MANSPLEQPHNLGLRQRIEMQIKADDHIKKALADEVLFGRLKGGGHVRVGVVTDEAGNSKLGFEYPDGPVKPRQEKLPEPGRAKAKRRSTPRRKPSGPRRNDTPRGSSVPNVPLVKV